MLEVYNERVVDLLDLRSGAGGAGGGGGGGGGGDKPDAAGSGLDIRVGKNGCFVEGLSEWVVQSAVEVGALLTQGAVNRRVASNNVNEHSSRSHMVVLVKVGFIYLFNCGRGWSDVSFTHLSSLPTHPPTTHPSNPPHTLQIDREDRLTGRVSSGRLCLCDLAGSERE